MSSGFVLIVLMPCLMIVQLVNIAIILIDIDFITIMITPAMLCRVVILCQSLHISKLFTIARYCALVILIRYIHVIGLWLCEQSATLYNAFTAHEHNLVVTHTGIYMFYAPQYHDSTVKNVFPKGRQF